MGKSLLPTVPQVAAETISILFATIIAAYIISQFPPLQKLVKNNSVTLNL